MPAPLPVEVQRPALLQPQAGHPLPRVTLLVAPSGYGKSTLLGQHARTQEDPVWLRLNEEDKDPLSLLTDLAQASSASGVALPNWERLSVLDANREQLLTALADDLNAHDADLTLYLDGGEYLGRDAAQTLSTLATLLGEGHRLLIAQRDASPFSAAPFLARGEGLVVTADQLRFTAEDTRVAARYLGEDEAVAAVQEVYQGWPWGIMLALHTQHVGTPVPATQIAQSVLQGLPAEVAQALPQLAALEFWSIEEAQAMKLPLPEGWLEAVQRAGLPLTALGAGRFAPHDVVRELLTEQLRQRPEQWRAVYGRAGQQAEARGEPYSALRHYVRAGQEARAVHLAEQLAPRWYRAADWRLAREALEAIPAGALTHELRSLLALAVLETGETQRGRDLAEEQLQRQPTATAHFALTLIGLRSGNLPLLHDHVEAGLALATQQRDIIQLLRSKAVYLGLNRRLDEGLRVAEEAVGRADALGDVSLKIAALSVKAYLLEQHQDFEQARREYERAYHAGQHLGLFHRLMPIADRLGLLFLRAGEVAQAAQLLEMYVAACERTYPLTAPIIKRRLASARHAQGRTREAIQLARGVFDELMGSGSYAEALAALSHVFFSLVVTPRREEAVEAFDRLRTLLGEEQDTVGAGNWITLQQMHAYVAYTAGDVDGALAYLNLAAETTLEVKQKRYVLTEALRGEIHRVRGQLTPADADGLREALEAQPEDLAELRMVHPYFQPLIEAYLRRGWHAAFFRPVLAQCLAGGAEAVPQVQVHLTTLGRVRVTVNDRPARLGHSPAVEALVYLLLFPEARQDEVADQVWGHGDLKRARQSAQVARTALNAAFHQATGQDAPTVGDLLLTPGHTRKNPQWRLNPQVQMTSDVQALLASREAQEMMQVSPDSFLPDSENEWVMHYRQVLRRHMAQVLEDGARAVDPQTALSYLVRAADLRQTPGGYELVIRLAQQLGETELIRAAQQAVGGLERGEQVALSRSSALN